MYSKLLDVEAEAARLHADAKMAVQRHDEKRRKV